MIKTTITKENSEGFDDIRKIAEKSWITEQHMTKQTQLEQAYMYVQVRTEDAEQADRRKRSVL